MAAPAQSESNTTKLLWAMPSQILNTSMGRDLITSLGKLFQDWNTLMKTECCLFLVHSKYFWYHHMVTLDKYYYVRVSTEHET